MPVLGSILNTPWRGSSCRITCCGITWETAPAPRRAEPASDRDCGEGGCVRHLPAGRHDLPSPRCELVDREPADATPKNSTVGSLVVLPKLRPVDSTSPSRTMTVPKGKCARAASAMAIRIKVFVGGKGAIRVAPAQAWRGAPAEGDPGEAPA